MSITNRLNWTKTPETLQRQSYRTAGSTHSLEAADVLLMSGRSLRAAGPAALQWHQSRRRFYVLKQPRPVHPFAILRLPVRLTHASRAKTAAPHQPTSSLLPFNTNLCYWQFIMSLCCCQRTLNQPAMGFQMEIGLWVIICHTVFTCTIVSMPCSYLYIKLMIRVGRVYPGPSNHQVLYPAKTNFSNFIQPQFYFHFSV